MSFGRGDAAFPRQAMNVPQRQGASPETAFPIAPERVAPVAPVTPIPSDLPCDLRSWLAPLGFAESAVEPLAGDVSPRRYARLRLPGGGSAILATYPPDVRAVCRRFLCTTLLLAEAGVRVPRVLGADCEQGFMLVEDLGERTLAEQRERPWSELAALFADALDQAARIAAIPAAAVADLNPPLDRALLERELAQTREVFLEPRGLAGEGALASGLAALLAEVCARLAAEPPVACHRDFMARNLIPLDGSSDGRLAVGVIDHQDLRLGPPGYDLASLLNDTLFPSPEIEEELLRRAAPSPAQRERYHRAAAQRTLKAIGTYAAFARRGVERHLPLVPPTLARGLAHLSRTPEGAPLAPALARLWRPVLGGVPH